MRTRTSADSYTLVQKTPIAVWRDTFAPYSETFIWNELRHHRRYRATVFALKRLNEELFPYDDVVTLEGPPVLGGVERWLCQLTAISPRLFYRLVQGGHRLIHAHFGTAAARALPYAKALGLPLVASFHGRDVSKLVGPLSQRPAGWLYRLAAPRLFDTAALVLAASEELRTELARAGCPESKLRVFRLGIDLSAFRSGRRSGPLVHIAMVGRLVEKKGFQYALRAIGSQVAGGARVRVTVAGDGPLLNELRDIARQSGIGASTAFVGALAPAKVADLLADADLLMAPSVVTALGDRDSGIVVVKEAAASHLPCIGTWHGGLPEIVEDGETGFLVPERDTDALSDRLSRLLNDRQLRERMGTAARAKMEREYDIRARNEELESYYDEVLGIQSHISTPREGK